MGLKVAVVGATGNVGREMLSILDERKFPVDEIFALASNKSKGNAVEFGKKEIIVEDLNEFDFSNADIALFSAGGKISGEYAPKAADKGCVVIDNSSKFRMDKDIPLIVPEVNADEIQYYKERKIIANPNCSTIQMVVALKPLHDLSKIKRIVVSSYQSTSGAGKKAMEELFEQTKGIFSNSPVDPNIFQKQISFNVIPQIGSFRSSGYTDEEEKMINETKKILDPNINVSATCVRVPTFIGHAESINIEFAEYVSSEDAVKALSDAPGCNVESFGSEEYITPVECVGDDATFISRIRNDDSIKNGLNLWVVSDNLKKGAALNTIQIAEILYSNHLS